MKKFFRLNYILIRNAWIRDAKISGVIFSHFLLQMFDIFVSIIFLRVVFLAAPTVGGWDIYQTLFLYAFVQEIGIIHSSWFKRGVNAMTDDLIRMGNYDFYLAKPYDSMLLVSISKPRIYTMLKAVMFVGVAVYALAHMAPLPLINYFWFAVLFCFAFILYSSIKILTIVPVFWIIKASSLSDIMDRTLNIMRYPATIYPRFMIAIFSTIFPILVISYLPAETLFFAPKISYIVYSIFISLLFLILARYAWKVGERSYSSASS